MTTKDLEQISELLDDKLNPIKEILDSHTKTLSSHTKYMKALKKTQNVMLNTLDGEQMKQRKKIERLEEHAGLN